MIPVLSELDLWLKKGTCADFSLSNLLFSVGIISPVLHTHSRIAEDKHS
jgi:uncharacterized membrane protein YqaE (UPF0057 family)